MAVTWDPAHKDSLTALSGGNLTATSSAGSGTVNTAVYATQAISPTVKQYFEVTINALGPTTFPGQYLSVGVMNGSAALNANIGQTNGAALANRLISGVVPTTYVNGTLGGNWGYNAWAAGKVIRIAIDRANNKMWWAVNTDTWFGSAYWMDGTGSSTCDPNTGIGGCDISVVTGTVYPAISSAYTGDVATANFGATAFAYTPPTGFVGLDTAATAAQLTQIALEQWAMPNAQAQLTQVALEQWASVAIAPPTGPAYAITASRAGIPSAVLWQTAGGTYAVPMSAIISETAAAAPPPVVGGAQSRVMILA